MGRLGLVAGAAVLSTALLVACGGSSSSPSPNGSATASPIPLRTGTPIPTAMPTTGIVPTAACKELAEPLPGTYTTIGTFGNVSGGSYAQYPGAYSGTWATAAYATPSPGPSPIPTASPSPTSTPSPQTYVEYAGTYTLTGFKGSNANGPYSAKTTTGCFLLIATQDGGPVNPGQPFNSYALGFPGFSTNAISVPVAGGNITQFTVSDLTPASGNGTFRLDNNAAGTVTITSSSVVTFAHARRIGGLRS